MPAGLPHAGRILVGSTVIYSDDRGATWSDERLPLGTPPVSTYAVTSFMALLPPERLPGAASGRDPTAPSNWPIGRLVSAADGGPIYSDDAGGAFSGTNLNGLGLHPRFLAIVRRPDSHPLGPGPRILMQVAGDSPGVAIYSSDDAGETWVRRAVLLEPINAPGGPDSKGIFALPEPGESDPGAGGRAVAVLALGHIYHTVDGGDTWRVVGRAPEMVPSGTGEAETHVGTSEIGPDGRLYIGVTRLGPGLGWLWRTADPFFVASSGAPPEVPRGVEVSVRPNPGGSAVSVVVTSPEAGDADVTVVDALGREVARLHSGALAAGETVFRVDSSAWAAGVYVVRAEVAGRVASALLVVGR